MTRRDDLRAAKHAVCGDMAAELRARLEREDPADGAYRDAAYELVEELERRGHVVHRAPRPTADAPALALLHPRLGDPAGEVSDVGEPV